MTRVLVVQFSDFSRWEVPAKVIATNRADYYAKIKGQVDSKPYRAEFDMEYKYAMATPEELVDWAKNNMNWKDVAASAKRTKQPQSSDKDEEWCEAEMEAR
jgi:hypothetical protein